MFCKHCGTQLGDNDRFCPGCGAPMTDPAPASPSYIAPDPGNPLLAAGRSPLFLVAVICASVVTLLQFISLFFAYNTMNDYIDYTMWRQGDWEAAAGLNMVQTLTVVLTLGALVMSVLLLIGLWMTYVSGAQGKTSGLVRGLKLVRGTLMAQMVYVIVMLALLAFMMLMLALVGGFMGAATSGYDYYYDYDRYAARAAAGMVTMLAVVGLVIILAIGVLMVLFYLKARKAVGYAIATAQTGEISGAPSMYLIVMCFIIGALSILYMVVSVTVPSELMVLTILNYLFSAAHSILFGAVALSWRNKVLAAA